MNEALTIAEFKERYTALVREVDNRLQQGEESNVIHGEMRVLNRLTPFVEALSSPCVIRIVRLHFDRHVEGRFFFNSYISLPKEAAPEGVNELTTLAYIVEEGT